jgi:outer membrane immunogenic protein
MWQKCHIPDAAGCVKRELINKSFIKKAPRQTRAMGLPMTMKIISAAASALALLSTAAVAADLPRKTVAPVFVAAPAFSWTGFYVGVSAGAQMSDNAWTTTGIAINPAGVLGAPGNYSNPTNFDKTGFQLSGFVGYNYQVNQSFVVGLEADIGGSFGGKKSIYGIPGTINGAYPVGSVDATTGELGLNGSLRGRLGFLVMPTVMLYATGGVAFQQAKYGVSCSVATPGWCIANRAQSESETRVGWTLGAGVEARLWGNWLGRAEYRYADYGNKNFTFFPATFDAVGVSTSLKTHTVQLGLAYKF